MHSSMLAAAVGMVFLTLRALIVRLSLSARDFGLLTLFAYIPTAKIGKNAAGVSWEINSVYCLRLNYISHRQSTQFTSFVTMLLHVPWILIALSPVSPLLASSVSIATIFAKTARFRAIGNHPSAVASAIAFRCILAAS